MFQNNITIRSYSPADLPALVDVVNRAVAHDCEDQYTTLDMLRAHAERFYVTPENNWFTAVTPEGRIVAFATAEIDPRVGKGWGWGYVDPDFRRQGIGSRLLTVIEDRFKARAEAELPPGMPLIVNRFCSHTNTGTRTLLEAAGFQVARISWFMHIDLNAPVDAPALPTGIIFRPFVWDRDGRAVFEAEMTFFRDNWGYSPPPFEIWQTLMTEEYPYDPTLWLVAVDQTTDQIVGLCLPRAKGIDRPGVGWIDTVGVRADYRQRGLGSALLRHGFRALQGHGFSAAELEVDSENRTNAVALYERAGMRVQKQYSVYRKALRGDPDLNWQP
ncbi:MAG: GNAT family N-acetyltransferase [Chloroflexi bacterium]|nr:GNAT family N-acetyltransferase [Chloroflexota bacterium]